MNVTVAPEFVGVVVADAVCSSAFTVQAGGVFKTVTDVETSSALAVCTFVSKKKSKVARKIRAADPTPMPILFSIGCFLRYATMVRYNGTL